MQAHISQQWPDASTHTYPETCVRVIIHAFPIYSILKKACTRSYVPLLFFFVITFHVVLSIYILKHSVVFFFFFIFKVRAGLGPGCPWPCPALENKGQGQGRQNYLSAGPDLPMDSLDVSDRCSVGRTRNGQKFQDAHPNWQPGLVFPWYEFLKLQHHKFC